MRKLYEFIGVFIAVNARRNVESEVSVAELDLMSINESLSVRERNFSSTID